MTRCFWDVARNAMRSLDRAFGCAGQVDMLDLEWSREMRPSLVAEAGVRRQAGESPQRPLFAGQLHMQPYSDALKLVLSRHSGGVRKTSVTVDLAAELGVRILFVDGVPHLDGEGSELTDTRTYSDPDTSSARSV